VQIFTRRSFAKDVRVNAWAKQTHLFRGSILALASTLAFAAGSHAAQDNAPQVSPKVTPYVYSGDLKQAPKAKPSKVRPVEEREIPGTFIEGPRPVRGPPDELWHPGFNSGPGKNIPGVTPLEFTTPFPNKDTNQPGDGPPDDNGAVGPNHYIAIVNFTFQIFDKSGNSLAGPTDPQTLWSSAPSTDPCRIRGRGDVYAMYDTLSDRFVITQFADLVPETGSPPSPNLQVQCIAVGKGPNPVTDGYFAYTFILPNYNDYPKLAVWPDGYYMISQRGYDGGGGNLDAYVFDRANMLNGNPAAFQRPSSEFTSGHDVIAIPSDVTGPPPPAGSPNFFVRPYDGTLYGDGSPRIEIFEFHTDWGVPANTTFGSLQTLTPAAFRSDICNGSGLSQYCVPQPPSTSATKLDTSGSIWQGGPIQYRNFGDHETLVFSHVVNLNDGSNVAAIRWYELRRSPPGSGSWTIAQQGTFAPYDSTTTTTTSIYRWTPSIAMDKTGNIALGYNVSNDGIAPHPTVYPGVRIVGRLASDPLGEMTTPEVHVVDGGASVNTSDLTYRWGDYSAMRVDPADGCTFWYTTEYIAGSPGAPSQQTRIAAAHFPTCNPANLSIVKTEFPDPVVAGSQLNYTFTVTNNGTDTATNVVVTDTLPANVVFLSSSIPCTGVLPLRTCSLGTMTNGASITFTIQVKVLSSATTAITNTASVAADQFDPDSSDNSSTVVTNVVESADLRLIKTCKPDTSPAPAGGSAFCTLQVDNLGLSDATGVTVTDNIVSSTPFTITSAPGCSGIPVGPVTSASLTCTLGTLAAGASATITVTFSAASGGDIDDTAAVSSTTPDPNPGNNSATGKVTFASAADLSVTKTAPATVVAGTNLTYTITVANAGPSTAASVVMKDTIPAQVSVLTVTPSVGSCTAGIPGNPLQPLTCTLGSLASGANATVTVVTLVSSAVPDGTVINNNATVSSAAGDSNNANNSATAAVTAQARADLGIVKTSDKPTYKPSKTIAYTVSVTNHGPSDALAVIVTDNLPTIQQASYLSDTGGCTLSGLILTCNLGNMPVGTTKSFNIYERVNGSKGSIPNTASVASSTTDPGPTSNTSTLVVTVGK